MVIATNKFEVVWLIEKGSEFLGILKPESTEKSSFLTHLINYSSTRGLLPKEIALQRGEACWGL